MQCLHDSYLVARASDDGGEDGARRIVTGEPGLAHTRTIVHHQSLNITCEGAEEMNEAQ